MKIDEFQTCFQGVKYHENHIQATKKPKQLIVKATEARHLRKVVFAHLLAAHAFSSSTRTDSDQKLVKTKPGNIHQKRTPSFPQPQDGKAPRVGSQDAPKSVQNATLDPKVSLLVQGAPKLPKSSPRSQNAGTRPA